MKKRCGWCGQDPLYVKYHDEEWGVPVGLDCVEDEKLFEFLSLEGAQAGLSWLTILRKRENYRQAFAGFNPAEVVRFGENEIVQLLQNPGIVRNQLKVRSVVSNARAFLKIQEEFGSFSSYQWRFVDGVPVQNQWRRLEELPSSSAISDAFSRDLKKRGFRYVGTTIIYAHMQAVGMVNDHLTTCPRHGELGPT